MREGTAERTMDRDGKERTESWVIATKLALTLLPFILLLTLFALFRWFV